MLLALMDEAYTGSTIGDAGVDSESEDSNTIAVAEPLFLELLKDENDGLAVRFYWFMLCFIFPAAFTISFFFELLIAVYLMFLD